jgi:hypothetical protein
LTRTIYNIKSWCHITSEKIICDNEIILQKSTDESIADFLKEIYRKSEANYPKFFKMDLLCKAGFLAAELITKKENLSGTNTALIFANCSSSLVSDEKHAQTIYSQESSASPAVFVYTLPNIVLGEISIRHQLLSENLFLIFDEFSPEFFTDYATQILTENKAEKVLAGWVEVTENEVDVLVFLIEKNGNLELNKENLTNLYLKK